MIADSRHVSRVLNAAGIPKASAYKSFGRDADGFGVRSANDYSPTYVYVTIDGDTGQALLDRCAEALTAAGFDVKPAGRRVGIHLGNLAVTKPSATNEGTT